MYLVTTITSDIKQTQSLTLPDGSQISLAIYYSANQLGWFISNLTYEDFVVNTLRISTIPNLLRQWQNLIPFGLYIATTDGGEPTQQQDFSSGYAQMYILTQAEVAQYEAYLSGN